MQLYLNFVQKTALFACFLQKKTPQLNGTAERANRTILQTMRILLLRSNLNKKYWPFAALEVVSLNNIIVHREQLKPPFAILKNKIYKLQNRFILGQKIFYLNENTSSKLDVRGLQGYYLGPSTTSSEHYILDKNSRAIIVSRHIKDQNRSYAFKQRIKNAIKDVSAAESSNRIREDFQNIRTEEDNEEPGHWIRRSTRQRRATKFFSPDKEYSKTRIYFTATAVSKYTFLNKRFCLAAKIAQKKIPKNIFEAKKLPDADQWLKAYEAEYKKFLTIAACERVPRKEVPSGAKVYRFVEILSAKEDNISKQRKYKARFAANGKGSIVHEPTYSPVASKEAIHLFFFSSLQ
eukprot:snap_masked-scaffold_85-processed-gene-0.29-mRNA-1 protein AED:0.84 eAED:0.89 QI:0/-1/0/1/-1/1/1/0/348